MCVSLCRVCTCVICLWKHVHSCLWCSMVTMGSFSLLFQSKSKFVPFGGHFWNIHKVWEDLVLVGPTQILRLRMWLLVTFSEVWQKMYETAFLNVQMDKISKFCWEFLRNLEKPKSCFYFLLAVCMSCPGMKWPFYTSFTEIGHL